MTQNNSNQRGLERIKKKLQKDQQGLLIGLRHSGWKATQTSTKPQTTSWKVYLHAHPGSEVSLKAIYQVSVLGEFLVNRYQEYILEWMQNNSKHLELPPLCSYHHSAKQKSMANIPWGLCADNCSYFHSLVTRTTSQLLSSSSWVVLVALLKIYSTNVQLE